MNQKLSKIKSEESAKATSKDTYTDIATVATQEWVDKYYKDTLKKEKGLRLGIDRQKMQYGGMADMSAAPMIKQPQTKKRKASGFRTKYSKGGGVRSSKYKL